MRTLTLLILAFCLLISCTQQQEKIILKKERAVISGRISNHQRDSRTIRFAAEGAVENINRTVVIDSMGNFRAEIEMYHPQNVQLFFKKGFGKLFLYPKDSIHLEIDEAVFQKEKFPFYKISGNDNSAGFSESIRDYSQYTGESPFFPDASNKKADEFLDQMRQEIAFRDSILEKFCKENKVHPEFKTWQQRGSRYDIANYLLVYPSANRIHQGNVFDTSLFPVDDDLAITTGLYGLHLKYHAFNLGFWQDTVNLNHLKAKQYLVAHRSCLDKIISNEKVGLSRDLMCYQVFLGLLKDSYRDFSILLAEADYYIETPLLKDMLLSKKIEFEEQEKIDILYLDPVTKEENEVIGDFWKNLKDQYSGKVIYVDIWATWCGPCRSEIPHARTLHEYFQGQDIAFVNLCLASDKKAWQRMIKEYDMQGENYFFSQDQTNVFREHLKVGGYPTYMIIDKKGKLIDRRAPRPSSKELVRERLEKLLNT